VIDTRAPAAAHDHALRVLVVDDSPGVRAVVRLGLETDGRFAEIVEAADGIEAIAAAQAAPPDVIVLDEDMPNMRGHEALPTLRQAAPGAAIVLCSARDDVYDLRDGALPDARVDPVFDVCDLCDVLADVASSAPGQRLRAFAAAG